MTLRQEASRVGALAVAGSWRRRRWHGAVGQEAVGVSVEVYMVLSQDKVLQCFVEQIIYVNVVDRVQQRFEEQDLEALCVFLVQSGMGLETWTLLPRAPLLADTCPRVHATVFGGFWMNFLSFPA